VKVVLDTHVLVSGLLKPFGNCAKILRLLVNQKLVTSYDARILYEYENVLHRTKFNFSSEHILTLLKDIKLNGELDVSLPLKHSLPNPDVDMFLEVAIASNAACIITGNLNHFPTDLCKGIQIYSPTKFIEFYKEHFA